MSTAAASPAPRPTVPPWSAAAPAAPAQEEALPPGAQLRALPYHRLALADHRHRRWSPLVEGAMSVVLYVIASVVFAVVLVVLAMVLGGEDSLMSLAGDVETMDTSDPWVLVMLFGSVAIWFPIILLARWVMRPRPLGLIWSVTGRIRWRYLLITLGAAAAVYVVLQLGIGLLATAFGAPGEEVVFEPQPWWWISLILMTLIVPIQCTAEELFFRGYLAQMLGRWLRHPLWVILLPVPLFMLGHLYDIWGQLTVGFMALVAGWLTWKTGGLEAAISLHVVNNMFVTVLGLFTPFDPEAATASVGWGGFLGSAVTQLVYVLIALWIAKRSGLAVTRRAVVWPRPAQKAWEAQTGLPAGHASTPRDAVQWASSLRAGAFAPLVPAQIPAAMAYTPSTTTTGPVRPGAALDLVPAPGLVAYAAPELVQVPGTDPPVYAHPVVWMAHQGTPTQQQPAQRDPALRG